MKILKFKTSNKFETLYDIHKEKPVLEYQIIDKDPSEWMLDLPHPMTIKRLTLNVNEEITLKVSGCEDPIIDNGKDNWQLDFYCTPQESSIECTIIECEGWEVQTLPIVKNNIQEFTIELDIQERYPDDEWVISDYAYDLDVFLTKPKSDLFINDKAIEVRVAGGELIGDYYTDIERLLSGGFGVVPLDSIVTVELLYERKVCGTFTKEINNASGGDVDGEIGGYPYVNMGSAGKWAICNIGANSPEEVGLYFAFGETLGYPNANSGKPFDWSDYMFCEDYTYGLPTNQNMTMFNSLDNFPNLFDSFDAATLNMGENWKMPTAEDFERLCNECDTEYIDRNGVHGYVFSLKSNPSKQLFFPAGGHCGYGTLNALNSQGNYWASTVGDEDKTSGKCLFFVDYDVIPNSYAYRCFGLPIRAIAQ